MIIEPETLTVVLLVFTGTGGLIGYRVGLAEKRAKRARVADRRARREELRHRAPEPDDEPETIDTTIDEHTDELPAIRDRFSYQPEEHCRELAVIQVGADGAWRRVRPDAAAALRGERGVMRHATAEIRLLSGEILAREGIREMFATVIEEPTPFYEEVLAAHPALIAKAPMQTSPDSPQPTMPHPAPVPTPRQRPGSEFGPRKRKPSKVRA